MGAGSSVLDRGQVPERRVPALVVVLVLPVADHNPGMKQRVEAVQGSRNLKKHNITNMQKSAAHRRLVQSLAPHGASLVLTGEPGCGKSHLAQQAAHAFATQSQQPIHQVLIQQLDELLRLCLISPETPASDASDRVLASLQAEFPEHELMIVALGIDNYHGDEAAFFEHLVRARHVRFIGTAQQVVGAADRLARDPGVNLLAVEPFTIDESDAFLSRILGVDRFARQALENWYEATRGNPHAIATLAIAADRRGAIHRARRMGWITPREDRPPADFVAQLDELSPLEQDTLELVAFAEPLHEAALLQLLDTETVTKLLNKQVLVVRTDASGVTAIVTRLPILAAAIREHLSPKERNSGCSTPTCSPTRAPTPSGLETRTCPWSNSKCSTSSHTKPLVMTRFCSPGQRSWRHWSTSQWARRSSPIFDRSCGPKAATQTRTNAYSLNSASGCHCLRLAAHRPRARDRSVHCARLFVAVHRRALAAFGENGRNAPHERLHETRYRRARRAAPLVLARTRVAFVTFSKLIANFQRLRT